MAGSTSTGRPAGTGRSKTKRGTVTTSPVWGKVTRRTPPDCRARLGRVGLVREQGRKGGSGRVFRLARTGRAPLRLAYRPDPSGQAAALEAHAHGLLQVAERDFTGALAIKGLVATGKRRLLWAARNKGWVGGREIEELNRLLERICTLASQPRSADRTSLLSLAFVMAPLTKGLRRRGRS